MYIAKSVMTALTIIKKVDGSIPTRANAIGRVSTPPPQTVATKLNIALIGDVLRRSESCSGFKNSKLGCLASRACADGQNVDSRSNSGSNDIDLSIMPNVVVFGHDVGLYAFFFAFFQKS